MRAPLPVQRSSATKSSAALVWLLLATTAAARPAAPAALLLDLGRSRLITQGQFLLFGEGPQNDEFFGRALAVGDFNCDGRDDLAVGAPSDDALISGSNPPTTVPGAGIVHVLYGTAGGLGPSLFASQVFIESQLAGGLSEADDHFGSVLLAARLFRDDCDDLIIGGPDEDGGTLTNSGVVFVVPGSEADLDLGGTMVISQAGSVAGIVEANDRFGAALAVGDIDDDGDQELVVGAPGEALNDGGSEGAVWVFHGLPSGVETRDLSGWRQLLTPDTAGVRGTGEPGDEFGHALAVCDSNGDGFDDLWIGSPGETNESVVPPIERQGAVHGIHGSTSGPDPSNAPHLFFPNAPQTDNDYGWSMAAGRSHFEARCSVSIGVPQRDLDGGSIVDAGVVEMLHHGTPSANGITREGRSQQFFGEENEEYDRFGATTIFADLDGDGRSELVIGAPGEDLDAGAIHVWASKAEAAGHDRYETYYQGSFAGRSSAHGSYFGAALAAGDFDGDGFDDLAIGVPLYDVPIAGGTASNAGAVQIVFSAGLFRDGFETGDPSRWSAVVGP